MNIEVKTIVDQAIYAKKEVSIELPPEECAALRKALSIIGKYRKLALQCANHKDKYSDWTMVDYAVKNDKVIVTIACGACG